MIHMNMHLSAILSESILINAQMMKSDETWFIDGAKNTTTKQT